ncbi:MAG: hypothetical protein HZA12_03675, partial [Nitrospirae bacterium]|nr:hypothetical protein [Nitrospirota bacterium]
MKKISVISLLVTLISVVSFQFHSVTYAIGPSLNVEPTRFFSTDWLMFSDYPAMKNGWAQLNTTLKDAGANWANLYVAWENIEATPSVDRDSNITHTYRAMTKLTDEINYLKNLGYRISIVFDPNMIGASWSSEWQTKVANADTDAQTALYQTLNKLAFDYYDKIDAWQIDQEPSDTALQVPYVWPAYPILLRSGYLGVKDGYSARGLSPSDAFVYCGDDVYKGWMAHVLKYQVENFGKVFIDGLSMHLFRTRGPDHDDGYYPRTTVFTGTLVDALTLYYLVGRDYGVSWGGTTPIGMEQTPYPTYANPGSTGYYVVTFEQQANYRVRKAILELTLGYVWAGWSEHLSDWGDYSNDWLAYWGSAGIIKNEGDTTGAPPNVLPDPPYREKPAWWALNTLGGNYTAGGSKVAGILKGARFLSRLSNGFGPTQHAYRFLKSDGTMVTVLWDANPSLEPSGTSQVTLTSVGSVDIISRDGGHLSTNSGTFTLNIGSAPKYVIGTLIESDWARIRKISNDGLPALKGYRDAYIIDIQSRDSSTSVAVTVPSGWTLPQITDSTQPGYVTVESGPSVPPPTSVSTSGGTISIGFNPSTPMPAGGTLCIYYGDVRGQAMLLDPGLNGVLDPNPPSPAPAYTPQFVAPPDKAYHKPARNSSYSDFLGYGFVPVGTGWGSGAWRNDQAPRGSIYTDRPWLSHSTDKTTPLTLKAKGGASSYQVKVYLSSTNTTDGNSTYPYLRNQVVKVNGQSPTYEDRLSFTRGALLIFSNIAPQSGLISVSVSPVQYNPPTGVWVRSFYGVDIWPSGRGITPGPVGENYFIVKIDGIQVSPNPSITVEATGVNNPPVPTSAPNPIVTDEETTATSQVSPNDPDLGDTHTYAIPTNPTNGSATVNPTGGVATYTPNPNFNGSDSFVVRVTDNGGLYGDVTIKVTVNPVNDPPAPTSTPNPIITNKNTSATSQVSPNDPDLGDTHTYAIPTNPTN